MKKKPKKHFTSDTHFGHKLMVNPMLEFEARPFATTEEMDEGLIERWNNTVDPDDEVFHLGDVGLCSPARLKFILDRLNGKIHLIEGNHEHAALHKSVRMRFESINQYQKIKIPVPTEKKDEKGNEIILQQEIILFHYPITSWNKMHYGSYHLHGHCHNSFKPEKGLILDVGIDNPLCNLAPISLEEVFAYMKSRTIITVDHHDPKTGR